MSFALNFLPAVGRDYAKLPSPSIRERIDNALGLLSQDPFQGKPLQGPYRGLSSYRIGDYRIVYRILKHDRTVVIYRLGHRREVYQ